MKITNNERFAEKLQELVRDEGITHEEFANKIHKEKDTVDKWFQAKNMPQLWDVMEICDVFEVDLDYFMGRIEQKTHSIQTICELTGLTPEAAEKLIQYKNDKNTNRLNGISLLLTEGKSIISQVLKCLSSFRLNDNIIIDILPEGHDSASLLADHYDDYMESLHNSNELEACSVSTYKDKGILAVSKKGSVIKINEDSELTQELIRQARLNKLTEELWRLADRMDKNSARLKLKE